MFPVFETINTLLEFFSLAILSFFEVLSGNIYLCDNTS